MDISAHNYHMDYNRYVDWPIHHQHNYRNNVNGGYEMMNSKDMALDFGTVQDTQWAYKCNNYF